MPDAVKAAWQDMEQEAADELVRRECHDALPLGTVATVVLVAEGDAGLVERNQTPGRDGDPVGIAREVGETCLGAEEGKSPSLIEFDQLGEEQAAEERAQHPHWQEEGRTRRYPALPVERDAAARHDHVDVRMVCHG